jgi:type II secretory ATPase GspE/PulE/Tfp pilus assembly ATPase PilB-like protein
MARFEEFAGEAEQARDATLTRLRAMLAEAQDRERRQAETLEQERQRQADAAAAAKVKAQQDADRAEQEKRAANRAHRARINRDAAAAIVLVMSELHPGTAEQAQDIAIAVVTAIAKGEIPAVQIQY